MAEEKLTLVVTTSDASRTLLALLSLMALGIPAMELKSLSRTRKLSSTSGLVN